MDMDSDIINRNIRIASFMGASFPELDKSVMAFIVSKERFPDHMYRCKPTDMRYHNDWNWIMPVAKKCIDSYYDGRQEIYAALHDTDIEKLFMACSDFIKWLAEQPPKDIVWPGSVKKKTDG